ncbi:MAG: VanZ family protein [Bacteroidales bacterium]|nr:VanZ family protein [Bacteroidales bacterium]
MIITKLNNILKDYYKSLVWAILILILSLIKLNPDKEINTLDLPLDKTAHFLLYLLLSFILFFENRKFFPEKKRSIKLIIFLLIIVNFYGIFMEFLQFSLTDYRSAELTYILSNFSGSIVGFFIFYKLKLLKL